MVLRNMKSVPKDIVREPGAKQASIKRLIDTPDGADRFVMSLFHLGSNGASPYHYHAWEHEVYILSGSLTLSLPNEKKKVILKEGDVLFLPRNEPHGFITDKDQECDFLVIAPTHRPPAETVFLSDEDWEYDTTRD